MFLLYLFFIGLQAIANPDLKQERVAIFSESLGKTMHYTLWIPNEQEPKEGFPLLVMLHGLGDTDVNWSKTHVSRVYNQIREEGLRPHIVVVPNGERGYWVDHLTTKKNYASWVMETIRDVESTHHIATNPKFRTLMGLSMGAWGALSIGLQHPKEFGQLVAMSPTDVFLAVEKKPKSSLYTTAFGKPVHLPFIAAKEPRELILRGAGKTQRMALVYGSAEQEKFSKGAQRLIATALAQDIVIEQLVVEGGVHSWKSTWTVDSFTWWMRWLRDVQTP